MATREELLARAQLLQKASAIQKSKLAPAPAAKPAGTEPGEDLANLVTADNASAVLQGLGQGAAQGYMPQINAAFEPAFAKAADLITGGNSYETTPDYATRRDSWIKQQLATQKESPNAYLLGQLAGGLTSAAAVPMASGGSIPMQMLKGGAGMAAQAALRNPGDEAGVVDPLQLEARGEAAMEPQNLIGAAMPLAGPVLGKSSDLLSKLAARKSFKALGPYARQAIQAFGRGKVEDIGRTALDEGVIGGFPASYAGLEARAEKASSEAGQKLGNTVEKMAQNETGAPISLNREEIANNIERKMISPNEDIGGVTDKNSKLKGLLENWHSGGGESSADLNSNIPLLEAELKKRAVGKEINWDRLPGADIPVEEQFNRELYGQLKGGVEQGGEQLAAKTGYPVEQFKAQKNTYGNLQTAEDILKRRNAKEFANRLLSPSDYAAGAIGAGAGLITGGSPEEKMKHALYGAGLGLVNKGARKYGNQIMATGANRLGQLTDVAASAAPSAAAITSRSGIWNTLHKNKEHK